MISKHADHPNPVLLISISIILYGCVLQPNTFFLEDGGIENDSIENAAKTNCISPEIIDDMEDGNGSICSIDGRIGQWKSANNGEAGGVQAPAVGEKYLMEDIVGGRDLSRRAAHTYGEGFSDWVVMFAQVFHDSVQTPYDGSKYSGVRFFAKSAYSNILRIKVQTVETIPVKDGGTCVESGNHKCYDSFAAPDIQLGDQWSEHSIPFSTLEQEQWGVPADFDPARLMGVEFRVFPDEDKAFDLWVDDLQFFKTAF